MSSFAAHGALAIDSKALDDLRVRARQAPEHAVKDVARQFETLFTQMLLKSMREAAPQDGMFDSEETRLYTSMLDQQLAQTLSARGLGLADVMVKQLQRATASPDPAAAAGAPGTAGAPSPPAAPEPGGVRPLPGAATAPREFVNQMWPHALAASRTTGIPPNFILGQAALESGWGSREIRGANGATSYNLFGVKAGRGWSGAAVEQTTTEYVGGEPRKSVERFRAYGSYAEAFQDYANLLRGNPRYAGVIANSRDAESFARGLQRAGYASDPAYADKLTRVINGRVMRESLIS